jgi:serine/threonine protein kinase
MVHTGMTIGGFEILERVKVGGMGAIFRGRSATGTPRAIKVVHPHLLRETSLRKAFLREAQLLEQLTHPGVVRFFHIGEEVVDGETVVFIAMEWLEGRTLRDVIKANRGAGAGWADPIIQLARQLVDPLAYVHAQGIAHRDIKPENIFLTDDRQLKLIDFGLAFADDENLARMSTQAGIAGTVAYMAPEVLDDIETAEPAARLARGQQADVFAAGICLHELVAGRHPCHELADGESEEISSAQLMFHMAFSSLPTLTSCRPDLAGPLSDWVDSATNREPDERFGHGGIMKDALDGAVEAHIVGAAHAPSPLQTLPPDPPTSPDPPPTPELEFDPGPVVAGPAGGRLPTEEERPTEPMLDGDVVIELAPDLQQQQQPEARQKPAQPFTAPQEPQAEPQHPPPPAAERAWRSIEDVQPGEAAFGGAGRPPSDNEPPTAPTEVAKPAQPEAAPAPPTADGKQEEAGAGGKTRKRRVRVVEPPKTISIAATPTVKGDPGPTSAAAPAEGGAPRRRRGMGRGILLLLVFLAGLWTLWLLVKQGGDALSCGARPAGVEEQRELNESSGWASKFFVPATEDEGLGMEGRSEGYDSVQRGDGAVEVEDAPSDGSDLVGESAEDGNVDLGDLVSGLGAESGENSGEAPEDATADGSQAGANEDFDHEGFTDWGEAAPEETTPSAPSLSITITNVNDDGYASIDVSVYPDVSKIDIKASGGRRATLAERNGRWRLDNAVGNNRRQGWTCAVVESLLEQKGPVTAKDADGTIVTFNPTTRIGPAAAEACGITN